jgi:hypothetical protein
MRRGKVRDILFGEISKDMDSNGPNAWRIGEAEWIISGLPISSGLNTGLHRYSIQQQHTATDDGG